MKQLKLSISQREAMILRDAVVDAMCAMRTNVLTDVVMSEEKFLALDISENKRSRYLTLKDYATTLKEFCQ